MPDAHQFREAELEQAIIGKLQAFMLELGKGFAFVARQHRISTETKDFFIDLVFYNFILKCFLLIDLKTSELTHEDIGKMERAVIRRHSERQGRQSHGWPDPVHRQGSYGGQVLCAERKPPTLRFQV